MSNHIFGPIPSRRLGRSLGVDLVPYKTCTYDCIYCQLGSTNCKTMERKEWVPLEEIVEELRSKISCKPDYITLSGSGEPTLFSKIDILIQHIKEITDIPVAVLTNGSLLWKKEVRKQLLNADLVIPSLDAADNTMFHTVNRPHEEIIYDQMIEGLIQFRKEFKGQYWLEVFFLGGYSAIESEVDKFVEKVNDIKPDRVQLNTVTRPPAYNFAFSVKKTRLVSFAEKFTPKGEVIANFAKNVQILDNNSDKNDILEILKRRPCTLGDIAQGLSIHPNEAVKFLEELVNENFIEESRRANKIYYKIKK